MEELTVARTSRHFIKVNGESFMNKVVLGLSQCIVS
jgi:hypothetical protein